MTNHNIQEDALAIKMIRGNIYAAGNDTSLNNHNDCFQQTTRYLNFSIRTLVIVCRDGTSVIVPPRREQVHRDALIICHDKISYTGDMYVEEFNQSEITEIIHHTLKTQGKHHYTIVETIELSELADNISGVYLPNADVVVNELSAKEQTAHHPFSTQSTHNHYLKGIDGFDPNTDVSVSLRFINNGDLPYTRLWAIFNGRVVVVTAKQSVTTDSGFYITGLVKTSNRSANTRRRDVRYSIEDTLGGNTPFPVFKTYNEAVDALNTSAERESQRLHDLTINKYKRDLEILKSEEALARMSFEESKREHEIQLFKLKEEKDKQDREYDTFRQRQETLLDNARREHDLKLLLQKQKYDQIIINQNHTIAMLKFIAAIIPIGMAIFKLIKLSTIIK